MYIVCRYYQRLDYREIPRGKSRKKCIFSEKNDGKASLRGYMHTNWPQQKGGEEKRVWRVREPK